MKPSTTDIALGFAFVVVCTQVAAKAKADFISIQLSGPHAGFNITAPATGDTGNMELGNVRIIDPMTSAVRYPYRIPANPTITWPWR